MRFLRLADSATRVLLPLAAYAMALCFVDLADWHLGMLRAGGLACIGWALFALLRRPPPPVPQHPGWVVLVAAIALLKLVPGFACIGSVAGYGRGPDDIGYTTLFAVDALDQDKSIYATPIDRQGDLPRNGPGFDFFYGYKYGPVTPLYYRPFIHFCADPSATGSPAEKAIRLARGLYFGNALLLLLAIPLVAALSANATGGFGAAPLAAVVAVFCLVFPRFLYFELFSQGVNDLLPTLLVVAALYLASRRNAFFCGLAIGLSLACKPLPAGLYLLLLPFTVPLLPLAAGCALGLCAFLPDLLRTPKELIANLVLFNLYRHDDTTGLAYFLPEPVRPLVTVAALVLIALVVYAYHTGKRDTVSLITSAALLTTVFLATGKIDHRNYFLWWTPLLGPAIAVTCYRPTAKPTRPES